MEITKYVDLTDIEVNIELEPHEVIDEMTDSEIIDTLGYILSSNDTLMNEWIADNRKSLNIPTGEVRLTDSQKIHLTAAANLLEAVAILTGQQLGNTVAALRNLERDLNNPAN